MKKIELIDLREADSIAFKWVEDKINELIAAVNELIETTIQIKSGSGPIKEDYQEFKKDK